ncbi:uncharacterized protein BDZ99DRAFT_495788 [Mytilinidion resinicola]|uniref:RING-type domain-containing protein n=1 Tax=Mytilinidion resinicola TaxID=574789 RepID=A0A6A6YZT1_9PEZI|nr:uncharacterized protein BDZ99DRAFT_495788 [Mytilinidion resinicola]KAF2814270.1 hypothetical protein BDZ99DRAFT_495788 [Mytilinidion resinicola]
MTFVAPILLSVFFTAVAYHHPQTHPFTHITSTPTGSIMPLNPLSPARRLETWRHLACILDLQERYDPNTTPSDHFEFLTPTDINIRADNLWKLGLPLMTQNFLCALMHFQAAMRYTIEPSIIDSNGEIDQAAPLTDVLAPYLSDSSAFCRDEKPYARIFELQAKVDELSEEFGEKFLWVPCVTDTILKPMWEIGQALRRQLNEGVQMLVGCYTSQDTYEPTGADIQVSEVSSVYVGPPEVCAICLENTGAVNGVTTGCGHTFHSDCLAKMINGVTDSSNLCSYCRFVICERRSRLPGPTQHIFDQHSALVGIHAIAFAREDLSCLKALYKQVFGGFPPRIWLADEDPEQCAWQTWEQLHETPNNELSGHEPEYDTEADLGDHRREFDD